MFASYLGLEDAVAVNSGTSALILALTALKIGEGDQVIVPNFTFVAPANAVELVGAETVLVDVNPETYNLHYDKLKDAVGPSSSQN